MKPWRTCIMRGLASASHRHHRRGGDRKDAASALLALGAAQEQYCLCVCVQPVAARGGVLPVHHGGFGASIFRTHQDRNADAESLPHSTSCRGLITALVVDEAQARGTNCSKNPAADQSGDFATEASSGVLIVQPELEMVLDSPELRQLKQRVSLRCQLQQLDGPQTYAYVLSRLERAGAPKPPIFTEEALDKVFEYSSGIPRIINNLCENSMVSAFAHEKRSVTAKYDYRGSSRLPADRSGPCQKKCRCR